MNITIPTVGESVFEALVAKWYKADGVLVHKDEPVCELETDKITLELNAEADGALRIKVPQGETVKIGTVIGLIDEQATGIVAEPVSPAVDPTAAPPLSPAVRKLAAENGVNTAAITGSGRGGRVTVEDVQNAGEGLKAKGAGNGEKTQPEMVRSEEVLTYAAPPKVTADARSERVPMTPIRRRIAERLLAARQQTAMLTTFNEADLTSIVALRKRHKEHFQQKHGVSLGFMSFFVKACIEALKEYPAVNGSIDGTDLVYHHYYDIGIAIGGAKGLVVPVLRDADRLHFHEIEQQIVELSAKVKENRLAIADLEGGTFTISNGGVYGSLLSTPIINPPQSGVLGMHAIQERAVVRDGQIVIRPMMYLALSYDHRIIDGREAVGFLKKVKELVEEPEELFLEG
jgi:2-oxoglutarate dehydrogenase E2 component (dihydrolipoamide succinyltransferase)